MRTLNCDEIINVSGGCIYLIEMGLVACAGRGLNAGSGYYTNWYTVYTIGSEDLPSKQLFMIFYEDDGTILNVKIKPDNGPIIYP